MLPFLVGCHCSANLGWVNVMGSTEALLEIGVTPVQAMIVNFCGKHPGKIRVMNE
jgi:hypothetical protein